MNDQQKSDTPKFDQLVENEGQNIELLAEVLDRKPQVYHDLCAKLNDEGPVQLQGELLDITRLMIIIGWVQVGKYALENALDIATDESI